MDLKSNEDFLAWTTTRGIALDARYGPPQCLVYLREDAPRRFWECPKGRRELTRFVQHVLAGLDPWEICCLWPRGGRWRDPRPARNRTAEIRSRVTYGLPVPDRFEGAVEFVPHEVEQLGAWVLRMIREGCCVRDDLFIVPDHGRQLINTDHHGVVHVACQETARLLQFIEHMTLGGYELPQDLPDATFKRPSWM
jgi:hypothetical protein